MVVRVEAHRILGLWAQFHHAIPIALVGSRVASAVYTSEVVIGMLLMEGCIGVMLVTGSVRPLEVKTE